MGVWARDSKPGTTPPASPLKGSFLLLALPLLGGRAVAFSRGPRVVGRLLVGGIFVRRLPSIIAPLLGVGGAEVEGSLGPVRLKAWAKLVQPGVVVAKEVVLTALAAVDLQTKRLCSLIP
jgi:hypothetical protein